MMIVEESDTGPANKETKCLTHEGAGQQRCQAPLILPRCCSSMLAVCILDLLGEIVLEANLLDGIHLRFNPIEMRVDILGHVF
jgi:hypothetical protein